MTAQCGTVGGGDINVSDNDNDVDKLDINSSKEDVVRPVKTSVLLRLPHPIIREILSFIPVFFLLSAVLRVSSYLRNIIQNESYWQNLWTTRQVACFSHYVQLAKRAEVGKRHMPIALSTLCKDHNILLVSVLQSQVPHLSFLESNSRVRLSNGCDANGNSVTRISIASDPLLLLSSNEDADTLTQLISHLAGAGIEAKSRKTRGPELGTQRGISLRRKLRNESLRLSKALCFLENSKSVGSCRAMIDDFHVLRLFLFSHDLPPALSRRAGTPEEHEAALFEFINSLVHSWECCHPMLQYTSSTTMGLPTQQGEPSYAFLLLSEEAEAEAKAMGVTALVAAAPTTTSSSASGIRTYDTGENGDDGVFFSLLEYVSVSASLPLRASSGLIVVPGTCTLRRLRFSLSDTLIYLFLLRHVTFSDIHQHVWSDERKCASCSRIVGPTGHAVELRFFTSTLLSAYPRFYVKMEFVRGDLPHTRIQEIFDQQRSQPFAPLTRSSSASGSNEYEEEEKEEEEDVVGGAEDSRSSNGNHGVPALASLFFGGYGRVEVDIPPTVLWENFVRLRDALGLDKSFPMPLLWNVVVFAAGVGGDILQQQQSSFMEYYQTSFTAVFAKQFPSTGSSVH